MNEIFSVKRFWNLIREHWTRSWRTVGTLLIALIVLLSFGLISSERQTNYIAQNYNFVQENVFTTVLFFLIFIVSLIWFYDMHSNSRKIFKLMIPASAFEQILLSILWNLFFLFIAYFILFNLINIPIYSWAIKYEKTLFDDPNLLHYNKEFKAPIKFNVFSTFSEGYFYFFLLFQIIIIILTLLFKRFSIVKTIITSLILIIGTRYFLNKIMAKLIVPTDWIQLKGYKVIKYLPDNDFGEYLFVEPPKFLSHWHAYSAMPVVIILWIALYFLLKEMEA